MAKLAFVGLGKMGVGMAARLLAAGHELTLYNRTASKADSLVRGGALLCATAGGGVRLLLRGSLVTVFPHGVSAFTSFESTAAHSYIDRYRASVGVRVEL